MAAGDSNPKGKRASKTTSKIENTFKNNEVKGGLSKKFQDNFNQKKEKVESGTVSGTNYPGENKNSTGAGGSLSAGLEENVLHKFAS